MDNKPNYEQAELRFIAFLLCVLVFFFGVSFYLSPKVEPESTQEISEESVENAFDDLDLKASAAYVYDIRENKVLYAKNENMRLPLASLTKVMASLVATEIAGPETSLAVTDEALKVQGDNGLRAGERWSLKSLLDFTLTTSSNDGMTAVALALGALDKKDATPEERQADFVRKMNNKAEELQMNNTYYWNVTGLDESNVKGGAYGSAHDMAMLFNYVLQNKPELLEATREPEITVSSLDSHTYEARNTDHVVSGIPGVKASKTGYTSIAGGNLVIIFDPEIGRPIIISVLNSTYSERFEDVLRLTEAARKYVEEEKMGSLANKEN